MNDDTSVRDGYGRLGVEGYYRLHAADYRNPHEAAVAAAVRRSCAGLDLSAVLDLACGSGEATLPLLELGAQVHAVDPYTGPAFTARTGREAEALSFEQIAAGALAGRRYSLVVCAYALHLVEPSRLFALGWALAAASDTLVVISPHKRPQLARPWRLAREELSDRVRSRTWRSD